MILAVALAIRLYFAWDYVQHHEARALAIIPFLFEPGNIASSIANGHGFSSPFRVETGPTAWMTPIYPLLLAGLFRIFGTYTLNAYFAAAGLNILFSTLACIPIYLAGKRINGPTLATVAAGLWAVFPNAILLPFESLWDASLSALLAATILWATLAVSASNKRTHWLLYGLLWGLALMTNAALVTLLPFLFGWACFQAKRTGWLAAAVILLCCVPWTIRNYLVFHTFVPLRSVAGLALWLGNNDEVRVGAGSTAVGRLHPISNQAEREKYVEMGEIAYMNQKQNEALAWMLAHPAIETGLIAERFSAIWTGGSTNPIRDFRTSLSLRPVKPRFYFVVLFNLAAAAGAVAGLIRLWRKRSPYLFPLAIFPLVFPLVYYLALAPPRYRHPIDPALLLLTGIAVGNYKKTPFSGLTATT